MMKYIIYKINIILLILPLSNINIRYIYVIYLIKIIRIFRVDEKGAGSTLGRKKKKSKVLAKILSKTKSSLTGIRLRREKIGRRDGI